MGDALLHSARRSRVTGVTADDPAVSCVLIFLDGAPFIDEAIRSVVGQAGFDEWELILVDDGSSDASPAIAKAWAATDPRRIRCVQHPGHQNRGMSASRNLGVSMARGRYVGFLDCDDVWLPSALAHRMRVVAANPSADLVIGGTWRWHSWTGNDADLGLDRRAELPLAPTLTTIPPPQLFTAIYGCLGGGRVPTMCSLLIRRDALLAIGGMDAQFHSIYEDQVLYVKAGLKLGGVIDPRPLALYRQHAGSACAISIAKGEWDPAGPSRRATHFFMWMKDYIAQETGERSVEFDIARRNSDFNRTVTPVPARRCPRLRAALRPIVRRLRNRRRVRHSDPPISVVAEWSSQFLQVITTSMSGTVLVILPATPNGERWTGDIPPEAFGGGADVTRQAFEHTANSSGFDHVLIPLATAAEMSTVALLAALRRLVRPGGTAVALLPGRAWADRDVVASAPATGASLDGSPSADDLSRAAREQFPDMRVSVETFGNAVTAHAVATGLPVDEVRGVAIDHHDRQTQVLLALSIAQPLVTRPLSDRADRAQSGNAPIR